MPLRVTYKSPPYRDKILTFDDTISDIRIGRAVGSEVEFPEEMAIVGHEHFAIIRQVGTYKFVINPHHRVYANGRDVVEGDELYATMEVRLGTQDGPRLLLEPSRAGDTNYVATEPQGASATVGDIARSGVRWTHILGGVVGVALVAIGVTYWKLYIDVHSLYASAGANTNFSTIIAKSQNSVFLVDEIDSNGTSLATATAWVVALPNGQKVFATNAHVGGLLAEARAGHNRLIVRSPDSSHREYQIADAIIHPAYSAFKQMLADAYKRASSGLLREVGLSPAYDVAILIPDKQDGLPDALKLAGPNELNRLHPGQPIAFVGYPSEGLVVNDVEAPSPTTQIGIITSVRNFFLTTDLEPKQFIEHSLPATGGASGSPIFDESGDVIALLSGGNNLTSKDGRIPNAALVNFAQRVDLLSDLVEGKVAGQLDADRRMWANAISRWNRPPEQIAALYLKQFEAAEGKLNTFARDDQTGAADPLFERRSAQTYDFSLAANTPYLVTAYTNSKSPIRVVVYNADNPDSIIETTVSIADGPITVVEVPAGTPGNVKVAVISEAGGQGKPDIAPVPFKLRVYWSATNPPADSGQTTSSGQGG